MNAPVLSVSATDADTSRPILKLVIMAVGGQGGGVLSGWIEAAARLEGRAVQATSVAGVAQRTGATIYYIEIAPEGADIPVFSLAPSGGDVDVLIAAELMEAGRAVQRGFVTPDRTTLIASTHRALAVSEKTVPGDGIAQADAVFAAVETAASRLILADMEALALTAGSVISASLLGALAASGAMPFGRDTFETAIRQSGTAVEPSLAAFEAGYRAASDGGEDEPPAAAPTREPQAAPTGPSDQVAAWQALQDRVAAYPAAVRDMARAGLEKTVTFQDVTYGRAYLDRLDGILAIDRDGFELAQAAAKHIANAMAYDDVIGVADKKTRRDRFTRIESERKRTDDQVMHLTEYLHPRAEEIVGLLPETWGRRAEARPGTMRWIGRIFGRGRRIRSDGMFGFALLYGVAGLRRYRPKTYRHAVERAHLDAWLDRVHKGAAEDYALAVELLNCRRLIKGYSDTHARGLSKFDKVMAGADLVRGRGDAADWVRRLREAALQDEKGDALEGALDTVRSFASAGKGA